VLGEIPRKTRDKKFLPTIHFTVLASRFKRIHPDVLLECFRKQVPAP
jgi:hypothetical protein